jgi:chemotaxis protein MotB
MITLLMAFFIMLYSMSILNLNRFREVAVSIRSGFGGLAEGQGRSILGSTGQFSIRPSPVEGETVGVPWHIVRKMQRLIQEQDLQKSVKLRADERGLVISLVADKLLFQAGSADLSPRAKSIVDAITEALRQVPNQIRIEGHTCDLPTVSGKYYSNWELSTARATTVVRYLIEIKGIPADRLSAVGYADSKPIVPNTSEANRAINRRVDIVLLRTAEY